MTSSTSTRVQKHRAELRASGMRPVQLWVPDTRLDSFANECKRQSLLVKNDPNETEVLSWLSSAADVDGWQE